MRHWCATIKKRILNKFKSEGVKKRFALLGSKAKQKKKKESFLKTVKDEKNGFYYNVYFLLLFLLRAGASK